MSLSSNQKAIAEIINDRLKNTEKLIMAEYIKSSEIIKSRIDLLYRQHSINGVLDPAKIYQARQLQSLYNSIQLQIDKTIAANYKALVKQSEFAYKTGYYGTQYAIDNNLRGDINFGLIPENAVRASVQAPVGGMTLYQRINNDLRYRLLLDQRQVISLGITQGWSVDKMARVIDERWSVGMTSALRIARTETTRNAGEGANQTYIQAQEIGVNLRKKWVATFDSRTRDPHRELHGTYADNEGYFNYGLDRAQAAGGFTSPALSINCRCRVVAELTDYPELYDKGDDFNTWKDIKGIKI